MIEYTKELNVASQCRATASDELSAKILVDGGSGTLRELLNDAASSIENLANDELLIKSLYESLCECFAPTWESGDIGMDVNGLLIIPKGEPIYAGSQAELEAEETECVHMCLDDAGVPRADEGGAIFSLWGRVLRFKQMGHNAM